MDGWKSRWTDGLMAGRNSCGHTPQDTQEGIRLASRSGKDPSWGLRTWIPMLALPSPCYVAL